MNSSRGACCLALAGLLLAGCKSTPTASPTPPPLAPMPPVAMRSPSDVQTVAYEEPLPTPTTAGTLAHDQIDFPEGCLTRHCLQAEIEARNPSLEAMLSAWQAATQLYPQRVALD